MGNKMICNICKKEFIENNQSQNIKNTLLMHKLIEHFEVDRKFTENLSEAIFSFSSKYKIKSTYTEYTLYIHNDVFKNINKVTHYFKIEIKGLGETILGFDSFENNNYEVPNSNMLLNAIESFYNTRLSEIELAKKIKLRK